MPFWSKCIKDRFLPLKNGIYPLQINNLDSRLSLSFVIKKIPLSIQRTSCWGFKKGMQRYSMFSFPKFNSKARGEKWSFTSTFSSCFLTFAINISQESIWDFNTGAAEAELLKYWGFAVKLQHSHYFWDQWCCPNSSSLSN